MIGVLTILANVNALDRQRVEVVPTLSALAPATTSSGYSSTFRCCITVQRSMS